MTDVKVMSVTFLLPAGRSRDRDRFSHGSDVPYDYISQHPFSQRFRGPIKSGFPLFFCLADTKKIQTLWKAGTCHFVFADARFGKVGHLQVFKNPSCHGRIAPMMFLEPSDVGQDASPICATLRTTDEFQPNLWDFTGFFDRSRDSPVISGHCFSCLDIKLAADAWSKCSKPIALLLKTQTIPMIRAANKLACLDKNMLSLVESEGFVKSEGFHVCDCHTRVLC